MDGFNEINIKSYLKGIISFVKNLIRYIFQPFQLVANEKYLNHQTYKYALPL